LPGIRKPDRAPTESKNKGVESRAKMDEEQHQLEAKSLNRVSLYSVNYGSINKTQSS